MADLNPDEDFPPPPDIDDLETTSTTNKSVNNLQAQMNSLREQQLHMHQQLQTQQQQVCEQLTMQTSILVKMLDNLKDDKEKASQLGWERESLNISHAGSHTHQLRAKKIDAPKLCSPEMTTLSMYNHWRDQINGYVTVSRLYEECDLESRRFLISASLDRGWLDLWKGLSLGIGELDDVDEIIAKIGAYVRRHRNPILDREAFVHRCQKPGELVEHYCAALRNIDDNCAYPEEHKKCPQCHFVLVKKDNWKETRIRDRLIIGLTDPDMKCAVLEKPFDSLTLEKTLEICCNKESSKKTVAAIADPSTGISLVQNGKKKEERKWSQSNQNKSSHQNISCGRCGYQHLDDKCPAKDQECHKCKKKGHFASKCRTKIVGTIISAIPHKVNTMTTATPFSLLPAIELEFKKIDGTPLKKIKNVLPDTGAGANLMHVSVFETLGGKIPALTQRNDLLKAANGHNIKTLGRAKFRIKYKGIELATEFIISDEYYGVLVNYGICKAIGWAPKEERPSIATVELTNLRQQILRKYEEVFDGEKPLKPMDGPPMVIKVKDNAEPFMVRGPRPLPMPMKKEAKELLDNQVKRGVLAKVTEPTQWVHGMRLVRKSNGKLRLCVDLRPLNKYVERPHHPIVSPRDAISEIPPTAKWFSIFDASSGYFQVPLAEESQNLTCFLTEWGRYKFLRATMGLTSAGDEFNRRTDEALEGIPNMTKLVDDVCIYNDDLEEHVRTIHLFLDRCQKVGITLNPDKMKLAQQEVKFAGYLVGKDGIKADPQKLIALKEFPTPRNITDLRSFQGLVEQLGSFSKKIAEVMRPLRPLLSPKAAFIWTSDHDQAFEAAKKALSEPPILITFDMHRKTRLETDAARTKGLGFVLRQLAPDNQWKLIEAGSRFLTDTESRYSMVELELLAVVWAMKKCRLYLAGLPHFELLVDHQPLRSILDKKTIDQIETPRIQRLKMSLMPYNFSTTWISGKENSISDALSRAPVQTANAEDLELEKEVLDFTVDVLNIAAVTIECEEEDIEDRCPDRILRELTKAAENDEDYQSLIKSINEDRVPAMYKSCKGSLMVDHGLILFGQRIVIPRSKRKEVLQRLHASHQGIERTQQRARQTVYWPGITSDVKSMVESCEACQRLRPSQRKEPLECDPEPVRPFQEVGADLFEVTNKHFLVVIDRYSGFLFIEKFKQKPEASGVIQALAKIFAQTGNPLRVHSDGGKQFTSKETQEFFRCWGIDHRLSSAGYPQSNGLAEAAVKSAKHLVEKYKGEVSTKFYEGLQELRNTPKIGGKSPAEIVYGIMLRSQVPTHDKVFAKETQIPQTQHDAKKNEAKTRAMVRYDVSSKTLPPLEMGDAVLVQDHKNRQWERKGKIVCAGKNRAYKIKMSNGRLWWRNRKFLKKLPIGAEDHYPIADPMLKERKNMKFKK